MFGRPDRLADRLGIGGVGLVPLDVGLDVLRRYEPDLVAKSGQLPSPVMGARAGLHSDDAGWQFGEKVKQPAARHPSADDHLAGSIDAVRLKHRLGKVKTDTHGIHGGPPGEMDAPSSLIAEITGVVHAIKWAVQRARYMTLETIAPLGDDPTLMLPAVAA